MRWNPATLEHRALTGDERRLDPAGIDELLTHCATLLPGRNSPGAEAVGATASDHRQEHQDVTAEQLALSRSTNRPTGHRLAVDPEADGASWPRLKVRLAWRVVLVTVFAGGQAGQWRVEGIEPVTGPSLPTVSRIDISAGAPSGAGEA